MDPRDVGRGFAVCLGCIVTLWGHRALAGPTDPGLDAASGAAFTRSESQIAAGDGKGALATLQQIDAAALGVDDTVRLEYDRAQGDLLLGRTQDAVEALHRVEALPWAQRLVPVPPGGALGESARALLAQIDLDAGRLTTAIGDYTRLTQAYPGNPDWLYRLVETDLKAGQIDPARAGAEQLRKRFPNDDRGRQTSFEAADALRQNGRYLEEYAYLLHLPNEIGPEWEIESATRRAALLNENLHQAPFLADLLCEELLRKFPKHPLIYQALYQLGRNRLDGDLAGRDEDKARGYFLQVADGFPHAPHALQSRILVSNCDYLRGRYERARSEYRAILQSERDDAPRGHLYPMALYYIARCSSFLKDEAGVRGALDRLAREYPTDGWTGAARIAFPTAPWTLSLDNSSRVGAARLRDFGVRSSGRDPERRGGLSPDTVRGPLRKRRGAMR